ncbi:MAG: purine-binding chemotaxis protein CheW [Deltaproteobacteria bacterium]|nr:purine-binding chemotaxis protein CheW [Deltaproteobacteria bacterium]
MKEQYPNQEINQEENDDLMQIVGFVIGNELFGVDILMVQEIIRETSCTAIPNAPDFIEGVINLRGNIVPVVDLRRRLNLNSMKASGKTWVMILNIGDRITGFVVDAVTKVLKVPRNGIKPPPDIVVSGMQSKYITGVCQIDQGLLILLDFNRILLVEEIMKLRELSAN